MVYTTRQKCKDRKKNYELEWLRMIEMWKCSYWQCNKIWSQTNKMLTGNFEMCKIMSANFSIFFLLRCFLYYLLYRLFVNCNRGHRTLGDFRREFTNEEKKYAVFPSVLYDSLVENEYTDKTHWLSERFVRAKEKKRKKKRQHTSKLHMINIYKGPDNKTQIKSGEDKNNLLKQ